MLGVSTRVAAIGRVVSGKPSEKRKTPAGWRPHFATSLWARLARSLRNESYLITLSAARSGRSPSSRVRDPQYYPQVCALRLFISEHRVWTHAGDARAGERELAEAMGVGLSIGQPARPAVSLSPLRTLRVSFSTLNPDRVTVKPHGLAEWASTRSRVWLIAPRAFSFTFR